MKPVQWHFWVLLLILSNLIVSGYSPSAQQQQLESEIVSVSHLPTIPLVGELVTFQASLQNAEQVDNVTLVIKTAEETTTVSMIMEKPAVYNFSTTFSVNGIVEYQAFLFVNNKLEDESEVRSFSVLNEQGEKATVQAELGTPLSLQAGNYSIFTPALDLQLNFTANKPVNVTISSVDLQNLELSRSEAMSRAFDISFNDTSELENTKLSLYYNQTLMTQLGSAPQYLEIQKREIPNSPWEIVDANLDQENGRLVVHPESFSQWVITASQPSLRFTDTTDQLLGTPNTFITLDTVITNFGGIAAEDIILKIITPPSLVSSNSSLNVTFHRLDPMQKSSASWTFSSDQVGEYKIIASVESPDSEGDVVEISINIENKPDQFQPSDTDLSDSSTNRNIPAFTLYNLLFTSISLLVIRRKLKK